MIPSGTYLEELEAVKQQLLVFAHEINQIYQAERRKARELQEALDQLQRSYLATVRTLAFVVEAKDSYTRHHLDRTRSYAMALARFVDPALLEDSSLEYGFLLHDVGKVGIPERILGKAGPLTPEEWEVMKTHPLLGVQIVTPIWFLGSAVDIIRSHHEHWDGSGYPRGLVAEEIPMGARVFAVADAFDAMTTDRPYRRALSLEDAVEEIVRASGTQFDPAVVDAFLRMFATLPVHGEDDQAGSPRKLGDVMGSEVSAESA